MSELATRKHVVIVGGGFAGLHCAQKLAAYSRLRITLIAAVAEISSRHVPIHGLFTFAARLGVHTALLTTVRAKSEVLFEWPRDHFAQTHVAPILGQAAMKLVE